MVSHESIDPVSSFFRPTFWSNIVFIIPVLLAIQFENIFASLVVSAVFLSSSTYHFLSGRYKRFFLNADRLFAGILTLYNASLVALGGFTAPYFYYVILFVGVALFLYHRQNMSWNKKDIIGYELYHALWHLTTSFITVLAILVFYF